MEFEKLAEVLLSQSRILLPGWLPGGRPRGEEYVCGSIRGGKGDSFSVNMNTGRWADFAVPTLKGGDLISLYAAINNKRQSEAFQELSSSYMPTAIKEVKKKSEAIEVAPPPENEPQPLMKHPDLGEPSGIWKYKDRQGNVLFYICRYNDPMCSKCGFVGVDKLCPKCGAKASKQMMPWSWVPKFNGFRSMGWPSPRPLYGLEKLTGLPVLIVEGEKCADAARHLVEGVYDVITWPNGSGAIKKVNWEPVYDKPVLIWPDADEPGVKCAYDIAGLLKDKCPEIKVIGVEGQPQGWDAADAVADGWDKTKFFEWAKPRVQRFEVAAELLMKENPIPVVPEQEANLPKSVYSMWENMGLARSSNGQPIPNMDNVLRVFESTEEFKDIAWYDEFHRKFFTKWQTGKTREWTDVDDLVMAQFFQRELGLSRIKKEHITDSIVVYGHRHKRNEPKEWLESLKWDGKPRIETFFMDCLGAFDSDYHRAASTNWWVSLVARAMRPGAKVDTMVILEGPQGKFKSTALSIIGGKWYSEVHESVTSKDFFMTLQGKLLVEISELDAFGKAETTTIKKVITCQVDRYRPPYGRASADFPRQCVFVGTTNETTYLQDTTGLRRFWPIKTGIINLEKIKEQREQLYAEALKKYKDGHEWYVMPGSTADVQESRREQDAWEPLVLKYLLKTPAGFFGYSIDEIADKALFITRDRIDKRVQNRIGKILRLFKYQPRTIHHGDRKIAVRAWFPEDEYGVRISNPPEECPSPSYQQPPELKPGPLKVFDPDFSSTNGG